jgi:PAS domain S-box-containing protein
VIGQLTSETRPAGDTPGADTLLRFWHLRGALMLVCAFAGRVTAANDAHRLLLGWSVPELTSVPYWELVHPDDRHDTVEWVESLMTRGVAADRECRMQRRDGRFRWIRWHFTADAAAERLFGLGVDLDDIRGTPTDCIPVGAWTWDLSTDRVIWSPEVYDMFGVSPVREITSDYVMSLMLETDRARFQRQMPWSFAEDESFAFDYRSRRDGQVRWLHSAGVAPSSDEAGQPLRGLVWDVTDRPPRAEEW